MTNLYLDFDGVILNTIEITYKQLEELKIDPKDYDAVTKFYADLDWRTLIRKQATQINDAFNCIKKIIESNLFNVYILSHVNSLPEAEEKVKYIRKHLDKITFIPVPRSIAKTTVVCATNHILIDDYSNNLKIWEEHGGIGVKFSHEPKDSEFPIIDRLDMIIDLYKDGLLH